jgi:hypothetical protein
VRRAEQSHSKRAAIANCWPPVADHFAPLAVSWGRFDHFLQGPVAAAAALLARVLLAVAPRGVPVASVSPDAPGQARSALSGPARQGPFSESAAPDSVPGQVAEPVGRSAWTEPARCALRAYQRLQEPRFSLELEQPGHAPRVDVPWQAPAVREKVALRVAQICCVPVFAVRERALVTLLDGAQA